MALIVLPAVVVEASSSFDDAVTRLHDLRKRNQALGILFRRKLEETSTFGRGRRVYRRFEQRARRRIADNERTIKENEGKSWNLSPITRGKRSRVLPSSSSSSLKKKKKGEEEKENGGRQQTEEGDAEEEEKEEEEEEEPNAPSIVSLLQPLTNACLI